MDSSLSFGPHIRAVASKAQMAATALYKILPNREGPSEAKRKTLAAVGESILLYAAPIWAGAMRVATQRNALLSVQRKLALRVCRGYRTISQEATMVIAAMIPIHLLVDERMRLYKLGERAKFHKKEKRAKTIRAWQNEWDQSNKGRWTWRLIRDIESWVSRSHGEVGYFLTQWLSGHGSFKSYKKRIGKTEVQDCPGCGETDTAEHAVFQCSLRSSKRDEVARRVGEAVTPENIIGIMLRSKDNWDVIAGLITSIVEEKEIEDRSS